MEKIKLINPCVPKWEKLEKDFKSIIKSKMLTTNKWTEKVEEKICKMHKCKYCLLTSSGTSAFMLLLKATEKVKKFNNIVMQDFTWDSTKQMVEWLYGKERIIYTDINKITWQADSSVIGPDDLFIPNMTFGAVKTFNHPITIYDSAHCVGSRICSGRGLGEILSFSPAKLVTASEGGAIITNDKKIYEEAKRLRRFHGRISELCACILYHNLCKIKNRTTEKEKCDYYYALELFLLGFDTYVVEEGFNCNEIVFIHPRAKEIRKELEKIMDVRVRYKPSDNLNKNSKKIFNQIVILPATTTRNMNKIIQTIKKVLK